MLNSVYAISLLMEYAAFVKLRLYHKDCKLLLVGVMILLCCNFFSSCLSTLLEVQRPYRIPVPDWAAPLVVLPPTLGVLLIFLLSNWYVYIFCAGSLVFGYLMFKLSEICKNKGWLSYETKIPKYQYGMAPISPTTDNATQPLNGEANGSESTSSENGESLSPEEIDSEYENEEYFIDDIKDENRIT